LSRIPIFGLGSRPTLWLLLELVAGTSVVSGAMGYLSGRGLGYRMYAAVILIALIFGVLNILAVYRVGFTLNARSEHSSGSGGEWWPLAMYLGLGLWIVISLLLGAEVTKLMLLAVGNNF